LSLGVRYFGEPAPTVFDKIETDKQHKFDTLFRFPATNLLH
jgi:hypothetical protein